MEDADSELVSGVELLINLKVESKRFDLGPYNQSFADLHLLIMQESVAVTPISKDIT